MAQFLVGEWVAEIDGLADAVLEVDRTGKDEVMVQLRRQGDEPRSCYLDREQALELGHALVEQALRAWSASEKEA